MRVRHRWPAASATRTCRASATTRCLRQRHASAPQLQRRRLPELDAQQLGPRGAPPRRLQQQGRVPAEPAVRVLQGHAGAGCSLRARARLLVARPLLQRHVLVHTGVRARGASAPRARQRRRSACRAPVTACARVSCGAGLVRRRRLQPGSARALVAPAHVDGACRCDPAPRRGVGAAVPRARWASARGAASARWRPPPPTHHPERGSRAGVEQPRLLPQEVHRVLRARLLNGACVRRRLRRRRLRDAARDKRAGGAAVRGSNKCTRTCLQECSSLVGRKSGRGGGEAHACYSTALTACRGVSTRRSARRRQERRGALAMRGRHLRNGSGAAALRPLAAWRRGGRGRRAGRVRETLGFSTSPRHGTDRAQFRMSACPTPRGPPLDP